MAGREPADDEGRNPKQDVLADAKAGLSEAFGGLLNAFEAVRHLLGKCGLIDSAAKQNAKDDCPKR